MSDLDQLRAQVLDMGAVKFDLTRSGPYVVLDRLVVGARGQGKGTEIMQAIVAWADAHRVPLALTASTDFGASSKARLERFYARFGFVKNAGRNKDFTTREGMVRQPRGANPSPERDRIARGVAEEALRKLRHWAASPGAVEKLVWTSLPGFGRVAYIPWRKIDPRAPEALRSLVVGFADARGISAQGSFMQIGEEGSPKREPWIVLWHSYRPDSLLRGIDEYSTTFVHEFIHFLDSRRHGAWGRPRSWARHDRETLQTSKEAYADYVMSDEEWNAHFQQGFHALDADFQKQVPWTPASLRAMLARFPEKAKEVREKITWDAREHMNWKTLPLSRFWGEGFLRAVYSRKDWKRRFLKRLRVGFEAWKRRANAKLAALWDVLPPVPEDMGDFYDMPVAAIRQDAAPGPVTAFPLTPKPRSLSSEEREDKEARLGSIDFLLSIQKVPDPALVQEREEILRALAVKQNPRPSRAALLAEHERIKHEIDALYWTFTRSRRGKPPAVVRPDLYVRRAEIERLLGWGRRANPRDQVPPRHASESHISSNEYLSYLLAPRGWTSQIGKEKGKQVANGISVWRSPHGSVRYVWVEGGQILSAIQVMVTAPGEGLVASAFTRADARRRGLARKLTERARKDYRLTFSADRSDDGEAYVQGVKENPAAAIHPSRFRAEFDALWRRSPLGHLPYVLTFSPRLSRIHARNRRRYAECEPAARRFFFAKEVLALPERHRLGLIAHEIGHALKGAAAHSEDEADEAAWEGTGVRIGYDRRWPGKGLQVKVNPQDSTERESSFLPVRCQVCAQDPEITPEKWRHAHVKASATKPCWSCGERRYYPKKQNPQDADARALLRQALAGDLRALSDLARAARRSKDVARMLLDARPGFRRGTQEFTAWLQANDVAHAALRELDPSYGRPFRGVRGEDIPAVRWELERRRPPERPAPPSSSDWARENPRPRVEGVQVSRFLPLREVERFVPLMEQLGVSEVARSPRGFLTAYRRAGSPGNLPPDWLQRREAFIARHMAQVRRRGESLQDRDGLPTRRHLALIAWAYSPDA